ncbi:MAG: hypothetical protein E7573_02370 [Ruminococcaceae bacterium]|nr:hypothetical protein [Oscillospiraceae bacterium]MBR3596229.1 zinc dependent phospholipase C family protein [Clostridia bacterium]
MKRLLSVFLALIFVFSIFSLQAQAVENNNSGGFDYSVYTNEELDLSLISLEDISNMSKDEFLELVREFERVYDPFDTYSEQTIQAEELIAPVNGSSDISPQWTSGDINFLGEYTETGTHEIITAKACEIFAGDKGFYADDSLAIVAIILSISLASMLPDKYEIGVFFNGHFYDPDTGENYLGFSNNTAKTNAQEHYDNAVSAASTGDVDEAFEELGRCLHYIQDANVPHHAANEIALPLIDTPHGEFENYAFTVAESVLSDFYTVSQYTYSMLSEATVSDLTHLAAVNAKEEIDKVNNLSDRSDWLEVADYCLENAVMLSAIILYKFAVESAIPFYYS